MADFVNEEAHLHYMRAETHAHPHANEPRAAATHTDAAAAARALRGASINCVF